MNEKRSSRKKWLLLVVKLLIAVVVVWAVAETLRDAWGQLGNYPWHFEPAWLALAGGLYLLGLLPAGTFWHRVLMALGQDARLPETLRAYYIGHLGKYVPGKAMVVVLRAGLVRSHRVDASVAAVSVFFETLTMITVGACISAAFLAVRLHGQIHLCGGAIALMVMAGLPTLPPVFKRLVRLVGVGRSDPTVAEKLDGLGYGTLAIGWVLTTLGWLLLGLSLWATLRAIGIEGLEPLRELPRYTACVALAVVAGFSLLVLPGGLGVREAALIMLLVPYLVQLPQYQGPDGQAAASLAACATAALLRVEWIISELVISGVLYLRRPASPDSG